jgi:type III pantothenate kinase
MISLEQLPTTTKDGISYGIIASIKALIDKHAQMHKLYFTGGDGKQYMMKCWFLMGCAMH